MKKGLKIYLEIFSFFAMITSLLYVTQFLNKFDLPYIINYIYSLIHIGSFCIMLYYGKELSKDEKK
jgi:hypothetical protein